MFPTKTDINDKAVFKKRQISIALSTLPDGSVPSSMWTYISQSIKILLLYSKSRMNKETETEIR